MRNKLRKDNRYERILYINAIAIRCVVNVPRKRVSEITPGKTRDIKTIIVMLINRKRIESAKDDKKLQEISFGIVLNTVL